MAELRVCQVISRGLERTPRRQIAIQVVAGERTGVLIEYDQTRKIFTQPNDQRTEDYVTGRFG